MNGLFDPKGETAAIDAAHAMLNARYLRRTTAEYDREWREEFSWSDEELANLTDGNLERWCMRLGFGEDVRLDARRDAVFRDVAARLIRSGRAIPKPMRDRIASIIRGEKLPPKATRPRALHTNSRDREIARVVASMMSRGFAATRNPATKRASACSIVGEALARHGLSLSEKTIEEIWNANRRNFVRE